MANDRRIILAAAIVAAATFSLFLVPRAYFVPGTFAVTLTMMVAAYLVGGYRRKAPPTVRQLVIGVVSAALLYAIFYGGNVAIHTFPVGGLGASDEASIYSLIASPSNPLPVQIAVLLFDAVGYESFFRGVLQKRLQSRIGVGAAPAVAFLDALLHLATLNPLWVATTFVADLGWGLTYFYGRGVPSSLTSHFVWDVAIFLARPIV